jgi:fucose permease
MAMSARGRPATVSRIQVGASLGALIAPLVIGRLLAGGLDWRTVVAATAVAWVVACAAVRQVAALDGLPASVQARAAGSPLASNRGLLGLGLAIACYVAAESGVSWWTVAFLGRLSIGDATLMLALFGAGLLAGRILSSFLATRIAPRVVAPSAGTVAAVALVFAVTTTGPIQAVAFLVVGLGLGPVYPTIMTEAARRWPDRSAQVSGRLVASGVAGAILLPPMMGFVSGSIGLAVAMLGAAAAAAAAGWLVAATPRETQ